jgi:hypothetical protein
MQTSEVFWVNACKLYDAALPFGGFKESGFRRELGQARLEPYPEVKTVWVDASGRRRSRGPGTASGRDLGQSPGSFLTTPMKIGSFRVWPTGTC